ncbi:helix-turn-helix domain-containing protein [Clostridium oryzae]|uniref:helix-turn-helix domain-containing protein n=1 Tax=Clostridium oryzae TaxID=1450648 RepID=UPI001FA917DA|nr:helix-turn-helix transcriptional regulator [Clostridium oryzae]
MFLEDDVNVFGSIFEYDFLSAWIKYIRIKNGFSQEALAHGICSVSHLSYFENGKKHLRKEIIEALLNRLNIRNIDKLSSIGAVRQKLNTMMNDIESFNYEAAQRIYNKLVKMEKIIEMSPYNIEFKIYELMYKVFVQSKSYDELINDISVLDKVYLSLNDELKYLYLHITGTVISKNHFREEAIKRQKMALRIKDTSWVNYELGKTYTFYKTPATGIYYLEKALDSYEKGGRYLNAVWCHNYLGLAFCNLKIYETAEKHFKAALMSAEHFDMDKLYSHLYISFSNLYLCTEQYEESIKWSIKCMENSNYYISAYNYLYASLKLNRIDQCKPIFDKYIDLSKDIPKKYYCIYFLYLVAYKFNDIFFYEEVRNKILPYYEKLKVLDICRDIKLKLIEYLENHRRYKQAAKLYKELL